MKCKQPILLNLQLSISLNPCNFNGSRSIRYYFIMFSKIVFSFHEHDPLSWEKCSWSIRRFGRPRSFCPMGCYFVYVYSSWLHILLMLQLSYLIIFKFPFSIVLEFPYLLHLIAWVLKVVAKSAFNLKIFYLLLWWHNSLLKGLDRTLMRASLL